MLRSSLLVVFLACVALASAQTAGRFAFRKTPPVPGFKIDSNGFRANSTTADTLRFLQPVKQWRPVEVSAYGATYLLGGSGRVPDKLRVNLFAPGFELHFLGAFAFVAGSNLNPYITWSEGSIGPGVPTPKSSWFLISFQEGQPPILLTFPGATASIRLSGKAGAWRIDSIGVYQGWVRIALPRGLQAMPTTDAASLGRLVQAFKPHQAYWTAPTPVLEGRDVRLEPDALVAIWRFNRPGAIVPVPLLRAPANGYRISTPSKIVRLGGDTEEGPMAYCAEPKLTVRFPRLDLGPGRAVVTGPPIALPGAVSPLDQVGLANMALAWRLANTPDGLRPRAQGLMDDFLAAARETRDPVSGRSFFFDATASGMDLAAAHALLAASLESPANPMLTGIDAVLDWPTWKPWPGTTDARGLAALAGMLSTRPADMLTGLQLEAGLVAEKTAAPYEVVRRALASRLPDGMPADRYVEALLGPVRLLGPGSLRTEALTAGYRLEGAGARELACAEGMPVGDDLTPLGVVVPGWRRMGFKDPARATLPPLAKPIPPTPPMPAMRSRQ